MLPTFRNIGGTVNSPYSDVVAPTAGNEDSLEEAGTLSKTVDTGTLEGPCRKAVATTGAQPGAQSLGSVTGKSISKGFRARGITEQDTTASSFKFNGVVSELQAKLVSGERLLRPVKPVKAVERREDFGAGENRRLGWESLLMDRFDRLHDRRSPEPRRRSLEDSVRTLEVDEDSDFRCRYHQDCHVTSGYGSLASG